MTGTVKWFNNAKGYGFIECADGPDVFVHYERDHLKKATKACRKATRWNSNHREVRKTPQAANVTKARLAGRIQIVPEDFTSRASKQTARL